MYLKKQSFKLQLYTYSSYFMDLQGKYLNLLDLLVPPTLSIKTRLRQLQHFDAINWLDTSLFYHFMQNVFHYLHKCLYCIQRLPNNVLSFILLVDFGSDLMLALACQEPNGNVCMANWFKFGLTKLHHNLLHYPLSNKCPGKCPQKSSLKSVPKKVHQKVSKIVFQKVSKKCLHG